MDINNDKLDNKSDVEKMMLANRAKIRVFGVGGAGNNAVNRMILSGVSTAEFYAVNTDNQTLLMSQAPTIIQIGAQLTKGLGAGAQPEIGEKAAIESRDKLLEYIKGADLVFITAGMGGGTGTGAAPIIAEMAKGLDILTVAVVTKPFSFEGKGRARNAEIGLNNLRKHVDTLVVIPNDKLFQVSDEKIRMVDAFRIADDVLRQGIQGISDLIVTPALINLDFADVRTIMKDKGLAHMGIGRGTGKNKTIDAVMSAINSPLLETSIQGATGVIIQVNGGLDIELSEIEKACNLVRDAISEEANIIVGAGFDESLEGQALVTVIATGFELGNNSVNPKPLGFEGFKKPVEKEETRINIPNPFDVEPNAEYSRPAGLPETPVNQIREISGEEIKSSRIAIKDDDIPPFLRRLKKN